MKPTGGNGAIYAFPAKSLTGLSDGAAGHREMDRPALGPSHPVLKPSLIDAQASRKPECRLLKSKNKMCFVLGFFFFLLKTIKYHKIHPFKVSVSLVFSVSRWLCYYHHSNSRTFSLPPGETPPPTISPFPIPPRSHHTDLPSLCVAVAVAVAVAGTSYEWNHTVCGFSHLASDSA